MCVCVEGGGGLGGVKVVRSWCMCDACMCMCVLGEGVRKECSMWVEIVKEKVEELVTSFL